MGTLPLVQTEGDRSLSHSARADRNLNTLFSSLRGDRLHYPHCSFTSTFTSFHFKGPISANLAAAAITSSSFLQTPSPCSANVFFPRSHFHILFFSQAHSLGHFSPPTPPPHSASHLLPSAPSPYLHLGFCIPPSRSAFSVRSLAASV